MGYKRKYRELSDEARRKISQANKGKPKSEAHRRRISQAMKDYWSRVPSRDIHYYQGEDGYKNNADIRNGQC